MSKRHPLGVGYLRVSLRGILERPGTVWQSCCGKMGESLFLIPVFVYELSLHLNPKLRMMTHGFLFDLLMNYILVIVADSSYRGMIVDRI